MTLMLLFLSSISTFEFKVKNSISSTETILQADDASHANFKDIAYISSQSLTEDFYENTSNTLRNKIPQVNATFNLQSNCQATGKSYRLFQLSCNSYKQGFIRKIIFPFHGFW